MLSKDRRLFELYAKLPLFKKRVENAKEAITEALSQSDKPYVAFSTGKDSLVVLDLVRSIKPDVQAVYLDADCAYPESQAMLDRTDNLIRFKTKEPFLETIQKYGLFNTELENITMETTVYEPIRRLLKKYEFDCVFIGLRAEESRGRRILYRSRGRLFFNKRDGILECQPVADWKYRDIWAYIVAEHLDYCGVYDKLWEMPEANQRLSYWAGESERRNGRYFWLNKHYPDLFNKVAEVCPEVRRFI